MSVEQMTVDSATTSTLPTAVQIPAVSTIPAQGEEDPPWLPDRLKRAQGEGVRTLLQELGVDEEAVKSGSLKKLIEDEKQRREAAKTELQRTQEALTAAQTKAEGYDALLAEFTATVDAEIAAIPEAHRETINKALKIVGDDPVKRMQLLRELKPSFTSTDEATKSTKQAERKIDGGAGAATSGRKGTEPAPADALRERFRIGR